MVRKLLRAVEAKYASLLVYLELHGIGRDYLDVARYDFWGVRSDWDAVPRMRAEVRGLVFHSEMIAGVPL
jgi:hypothetical protein